MDRTVFENSSTNAAIAWIGKAEISSSRFVQAGGAFISGDKSMTSSLTNSLFWLPRWQVARGGFGRNTPFDRLIVLDTVLNVESSTIKTDNLECARCGYPGIPLFSMLGQVNFKYSAVGYNVKADAPDYQPVLGSQSNGAYTADAYTWISPRFSSPVTYSKP